MRKLKEANFDITPMDCPWNEGENNTVHKCVCEGKPKCDYFRGIEYIDTMMCEYPVNKA